MNCIVFMQTVFLVLNVICYVSAQESEINKHCLVVKECGKYGYFCAGNRTCQCKTPAYTQNSQRTRCVGYVNSKCQYDEHCVDGAFCEQNIRCKCKESFQKDDDGSCVPNSAKNIAYQRYMFPFTCVTTVLINTLVF